MNKLVRNQAIIYLKKFLTSWHGANLEVISLSFGES